MSLPRLALRRPVGTAMVSLAVAVLGSVSFLRLPVDLLPDVAFPTLAVSTAYRGAGPTEVERFVTEPVEAGLSRVAGVREVSSRSREGLSLVRLRFHWGTDMEFATLHVRERLDNVVEGLPEGAERPVILTTDPTSEPILTLAVTGPDLLALRELSEAVFKRRLEQLDGVALAAVAGGPRREIRVVVDPLRLEAQGIRLEAVTEALDRANYSAPGGMVRQGRFRYSLRTLGLFTSVDQLREVPVEASGPAGGGGGAAGGGTGAAGGVPGGTVRLGEVADVVDALAEPETEARWNGLPAVGIQVHKEAGANTVRVAERVEATLASLREGYPEVGLTVAASQAAFVRDAIANVAQALLLGGALAFLVLFLFLREPRYPVAIGLAIPLSVLAAFGLCYAFDVTLNVMSLGGLALGVGMLVDNSIVVLENVFRHRDDEGAAPLEAAGRGASEVAAAITASTLTTIAVFGPVLYVEGVAGALFADLSLTVTFSLLASLLAALTLLPVLVSRGRGTRAGAPGPEPGPGARAGVTEVPGPSDVPAPPPGRPPAPAGPARDPVAPTRWARSLRRRASNALRYIFMSVRDTIRDLMRLAGRVGGWLLRPFALAFDGLFGAFARRYERALAWSLEHRAAVLGMAAASLALALLVAERLPMGLMPEVDEGRFRVVLELPVGTPLETTARDAARLEALLLELEGVEGVFTRVGRPAGSELVGFESAGPNRAVLEVGLDRGVTSTARAVAAFRTGLRATGVEPLRVAVETGQATSLGRALALGEADLAVQVKGRELEELVAVAESAAARMAGVEVLRDVRVDFQRDQPELEVGIDRGAVARHGLTVRQVADAMEGYLRGVPTERPFMEFANRIDIRVLLTEEARRRLDEVLELPVEGVPLGELVTVRPGYGPVEIRREGQSRTVRVLADVGEGGLARAVEATRRAVAGLELPPLAALQVGGQNREMRESFRSLLQAFGLALLLVFLILAAQFESVVQPVTVLAAVPLSLVGAVLALAAAGSGLNVMSGIGAVILVGIVVNDAIIKVDFINQRRAAGLGKRAAVLEAGRLRLRPIVMTTVTTVLGLTPMALGWGAGADLRAPLALAVIGGLLSATFLTLLVVPVVYSLLVDPAVPVGREAGPPPATVGPGGSSAPGPAAGGER